MADEETEELVLDQEAPPEDDEFTLHGFDEDDEADRPDDTPAIRKMRDTTRDALVRATAAERKLAAMQAAPPSQANEPLVEVGNEPELSDYWDAGKDDKDWKRDHQAWLARRDKRAQQDRRREDDQRNQQAEAERLDRNYREKIGKLGKVDFADAEKRVRGVLSEAAQFAIAKLADDPARVVYALDKNPKELKRFLEAPDVAMQIKILGSLEERMKHATSTRKAPPSPEAETIQRGTASVARVSADKKLEQLEKGLTSGTNTDGTEYFKRLREQRRASK